MADISILSRLVSGLPRNVDLSSNTLVMSSLKLGTSELTKAKLDLLALTADSPSAVDASAQHHHDGRYTTTTALAAQTNGASGASLIGIDVTPAFTNFTSGSNVQSALEGIDSALGSAGTSDFAEAAFRVSQTTAPALKLSFILSALTASRAITMPDAAVDLGLVASALQKAGGTMSGAIAMGGSKITGLGAPSANGDALRFDQLGAANGIATLDASSLIPISQIPPAALERLVIVADQTARFALTTATVQNGDTVKQTDTGVMYFVSDDANLDSAAGYTIYTAGTASAVAWSGITGVPAPVSSLSGTNTGDQTATTVPNTPAGNISATTVQAAIDELDSEKEPANANIQSHISSSANPHAVTKAQVGLGNADNTADANKDVASAINIKAASEVAGEAFAATTLFAVRYGQNAETAGRMYKADNDASSTDNFYVIGLVTTVGALSAADPLPVVTKSGLYTATAHGLTVGKPVYLGVSGALTSTAPSSSGEAVVKVGIVKSANVIDIQIQAIGVN